MGLNGFYVRIALRNWAVRLLSQQSADQSLTKTLQGEPLLALLCPDLGPTDFKVHQRLIWIAPIDGQRRYTRAGDEREGEKPLAQDLAQRLKASYALTDPFKPAISSNRFQGKLHCGGTPNMIRGH